MNVNFCYKILPLKNAGIPLVILKQVKKNIYMFKNKKKSLKILDAQYHFRFLKQFTYQPISSWVHWKRANTLLYFGLPFTSQNKKCMRSPTDKPLHPCS